MQMGYRYLNACFLSQVITEIKERLQSLVELKKPFVATSFAVFILQSYVQVILEENNWKSY